MSKTFAQTLLVSPYIKATPFASLARWHLPANEKQALRRLPTSFFILYCLKVFDKLNIIINNPVKETKMPLCFTGIYEAWINNLIFYCPLIELNHF